MTQQSIDFHKVADWAAGTISVGWVMQVIPDIIVILNGIYILFRLYDWIEGRIKRARSKQDESE